MDHSRAQLRGNGEGDADPQRDWRQVAVLYLTQPRLFGLRVGARFGSRVIGDVPDAAVGPFWATSDKPEDCDRKAARGRRLAVKATMAAAKNPAPINAVVANARDFKCAAPC